MPIASFVLGSTFNFPYAVFLINERTFNVMHLSVFLWLVLLRLGELAGLGGAVCPQLVSPDVRAWKAQKTVHTGTRLPAVCLSVPWCSRGQEDDLGVGGHRPVGPQAVSGAGRG